MDWSKLENMTAKGSSEVIYNITKLVKIFHPQLARCVDFSLVAMVSITVYLQLEVALIFCGVIFCH